MKISHEFRWDVELWPRGMQLGRKVFMHISWTPTGCTCFNVQYSPDGGEPWCAEFPPFVVGHFDFNAIVSTFRDWFRRIQMRPTGWRVPFAQSSAMQITLSIAQLPVN